MLFSFSSVVVVEGVPPGDDEFVIEVTGLPDDDKLGLLFVLTLMFPLVSFGVLLVVDTDDEEELSLLFVDVVTMELVDEDKDDMDPTRGGGGGGKMFGLTGYLRTSTIFFVCKSMIRYTRKTISFSSDPKSAPLRPLDVQ